MANYKPSAAHIAAMQAGRWAKRETLSERFWKKVNKDGPSGCWLWTGAKNTNGYGTVGNGYNPESKNRNVKMFLAHRVAWGLAGNELPKWPMVIDHICKTRLCVNAAHLRVVPQSENTTIYADRAKSEERRQATMAAKKAAGWKYQRDSVD